MAAVVVQEKILTGGATSSAQVVAFDSPVSSGNAVIVVHQGGIATITVSDTATGSYGTAVVSRNDGGSKQVTIFAKHNISSGGFTGVTLQAGSAFYSKPALFEVSGLSTVVVSGSNDQNSSLYALSSSPLTGTGFACGGLATGSGVGSPTFDTAYTSTNDGFGLIARGSSASQVFTNTQCTGRANGGTTTQISALAIFSDVLSAAVGLRAGMRMLYGVGR